MKVSDINAMSSGEELDTDLCIVGSGPAGLALAREFFGTDTRVLIVESGDRSLSESAERLSAIESVGAARELNQSLVRTRAFGGSSHAWLGKCIPLSEIDFAERPWVPNSGWPLSAREFDSALERAAELLSLGPGVYDEAFWALLKVAPPEPRFDHSLLEEVFWQYAKNRRFPFEPMRMGEPFLSKQVPNVRVLLNACATHVDTDANETRLEGVEVRGLSGTLLRVRARATVLCAGGIESARLLLASNRIVKHGVGNRWDQVGRYLMDHPRTILGYFDPSSAHELEERFDFFQVRTSRGTRSYLPGLALSPALQEREGLLHCAAWIGRERKPDDAWSKVRALASGRSRKPLTDARAVVSNAGLLSRGVYRRVVKQRGLVHDAAKVELWCMVEQIPDPESRITLGSKLDALGVPIAVVDWRVHRSELQTMARLAQIIADELGRAGLPRPSLVDWAREGKYQDAPIIDVAHPTGATRMSVHPAQGVVDTNCQVHGVAGLYVAGSSVFPTAGHANPTLMVAATAIRLADHLKTKLSTRAKAVRSRGTQSAKGASMNKRVLVTGGSGRIGRSLVNSLIARGYDVAVVTSRQRAAEAGITWIHMDWRKQLDFAPHVEGCDAVMHLGAELRDVTHMQRVNAEATRELALASERAGVRFFAYASTISVYGSPTERAVCEDSAVLARDSDYFAEPYMRMYAMTKLAGEQSIREIATRTNYAIFRPSVVCNEAMIEDMRHWNVPRRLRCAGRLTNHVCTDDVVAAFLWSMERALASDQPVPGVELYNISDEDVECNTYAKLYRLAYRKTKDARFLCPVYLPSTFDLVKDTARYHGSLMHPRFPLGMVRFSSDKLKRAGFQRPLGLSKFYEAVFSRIGGLA